MGGWANDVVTCNEDVFACIEHMCNGPSTDEQARSLTLQRNNTPEAFGIMGITIPILDISMKGTWSVVDYRELLSIKIFERCVLYKFEDKLQSDCQQFGFKRGLAIETPS